jgi:hypothetical protein
LQLIESYDRQKEIRGGEMRKKITKWVAWYMVTTMVLFGITPRAHAGFSPSEGLALLQQDRQADIQKIQRVLEVKLVSERLRALGFAPGEIQARLSQLNDQQIHQLAQKIEELNVGGEAEEWQVMIVSLLIVAIFVFVINYLLKHWLLKE